jgi:leucine dehydrogenase
MLPLSAAAPHKSRKQRQDGARRHPAGLWAGGAAGYAVRVELGRALADGGLTTLRLIRRAPGFELGLGRDWDPDLAFEGYTRDFQLDQVPCRDPLVLGDGPARDWIAERGAGSELEALEAMMETGRHEMLELFVHAELDLRVVHHVHSSRLGANNGFHALRAGGLRRHDPKRAEREVLADGLNLSRAMSFKCAAAGLPFGGSKTTVQTEPVALDDSPRLGFLAYAIDRGNLITGPDMGFAPELIDVLGRYTQHILCGPAGPLGHTGAPTALGVFTAMRAGAEHAWGSPSLEYRTIAIQGVGAVGLELAKLLAEARAKLIVADADPARLAHAQHEVGGLRVVSPEQILEVECDVLAPCAVGGVLDERVIDRLACALVFGSANNQLAASSTEDEIALAARIAGRAILFAPDWSYTMGGIIAGFEEYVYRERASHERVAAAIEMAVSDGLRELFGAAGASGRTPTELAYERFTPLVSS